MCPGKLTVFLLKVWILGQFKRIVQNQLSCHPQKNGGWKQLSFNFVSTFEELHLNWKEF